MTTAVLRAVLAAAMVTAGSAASASAQQEERSHTISARAGYWIPLEGVLRDVLGNGLSLGASLSFPLKSDKWLDFELTYWHRQGELPPLEDLTQQGAFTYRTSKVTLVPLALSLRAQGRARHGIKPLILGGINLTLVKEEVTIRQTAVRDSPATGTNTLSNAFLGFHFALGAERDVSAQTAAFLEVRVSIVNSDTPSVNGVVGNGASLGGTGIYAGLRFR